MAGLFDSLSPEILGLLGGQGQGTATGGGQGLLAGGRFQPKPDESWQDRVFGTNAPGDHRGLRFQAFASGLAKGDIPGALLEFEKTRAQLEDRDWRRRVDSLGLLKGGLEISELQRKHKDDAESREVLKNFYRNRGAAGGGQASPPAFSLPSIDGEPMPVGMGPASPTVNSFDFLEGLPSVGGQDGGGYGGYGGVRQGAAGGQGGGAGGGAWSRSNPAPASRIDGNEFVLAAQKHQLGTDMQTLNKIVGLVNGGLSPDDAARQVASGGSSRNVGGGDGGFAGGSGVGTSGAPSRSRSAVFDQYTQLGDAFAAKGLVNKAQQYYELAEKYRPKYNTTPQFMTKPGRGLVPVLIGEDGATQELNYGPKPDITIEDFGDVKRVIDKNNVRAGESYQKTMTPGEMASNRVARANLQVAQDRLALDQTTPQYVQTDGGYIALPKRPPAAGPIVGRPVTGEDGKPLAKAGNVTEGERKAATLLKRLEGSQAQLNDALAVNPDAATPGVWASGARAIGADAIANTALTGAQRQRVEAAQLDMLDAALTLGTGAAYTREQLMGYRQSYFPQIGDSDDVIADKENRLNNVIGAAKIAAGRAAPQVEQTWEPGKPGVPADPTRPRAVRAQPLPANPNQLNLKKGTWYDIGGGKQAEYIGGGKFRTR